MPVRARKKRVTFYNSEHEYEPIAAPSPSPKPAVAPVVRISDTDVMPVADSDDSIDDRGRLPPELTQAGDVRLPLDGKIEDIAMEGRELGETGDTSEEMESPQQLQERLEERFLSTATPGAESRTDGEVNTSQVRRTWTKSSRDGLPFLTRSLPRKTSAFHVSLMSLHSKDKKK